MIAMYSITFIPQNIHLIDTYQQSEIVIAFYSLLLLFSHMRGRWIFLHVYVWTISKHACQAW